MTCLLRFSSRHTTYGAHIPCLFLTLHSHDNFTIIINAGGLQTVASNAREKECLEVASCDLYGAHTPCRFLVRVDNLISPTIGMHIHFLTNSAELSRDESKMSSLRFGEEPVRSRLCWAEAVQSCTILSLTLLSCPDTTTTSDRSDTSDRSSVAACSVLRFTAGTRRARTQSVNVSNQVKNKGNHDYLEGDIIPPKRARQSKHHTAIQVQYLLLLSLCADRSFRPTANLT